MGNYDSGRAPKVPGWNIASTRSDSLNGIRFASNRSAPSSSDDFMLYRRSDSLYLWDGSSEVLISAGGSGTAGTLDSNYDNGSAINVDAGSVTLNGVDEDTAVLSVTGDGDSTGALLKFSHNTTSRNDILGSGSNWAVTGAGKATLTAVVLGDDETITFGADDDITIEYDEDGNNEFLITGATGINGNVNLRSTSTFTQAGNAGSTVFTITAGDAVLSDGSLSITDADNAESVTVINNTATTLGNASSGAVVQVESTSLTTGAAVNVQLTEGTLNGGYYYSAWDATAGARVFSVAENGAVTITGAGGSDSLTISNGDVVVSDGSLSLTDADDAESVTIINNTATTVGAAATSGIVQVESTSLTTGAAVNVQLTEGTLNGGYYYSAWDATGSSRVFSVAENGAVTIAGDASGTDALTLTAGDITVTSGDVTLASGDTVLTSGDLTLTSGDATVTDGATSLTVADTSNHVVLTTNQNDTTNNDIGVQLNNAGTGNDLEVINTGAGATGSVLSLYQNSASPAASDVVGRVLFEGEDAGDNRTVYARVDVSITDTTGGSEDGDLLLYVMRAGTVTQQLQLDSDTNGIIVGDGAAAGIIESNGDFDVTLQTGNSTTGSITITDGADGDITLAPNGSGNVAVGSGAAAGTLESSGDYDLTLQTGNSTTGTLTITDGADGNITITPNGAGQVDLANAVLFSKTQSLTGAGAVDVVSSITEVDTTGGAAALTLADGTEGQIKFITMVTDAGDGTLTPTNLTGNSTVTFGDVGDSVTLLFTNGSWSVMSNVGATLA